MNEYEKRNVEKRIAQERADASGLQHRIEAKSIQAAHTSGTQKGILIGGAVATIFYAILWVAYEVLRAWGIIHV